MRLLCALRTFLLPSRNPWYRHRYRHRYRCAAVPVGGAGTGTGTGAGTVDFGKAGGRFAHKNLASPAALVVPHRPRRCRAAGRCRRAPRGDKNLGPPCRCRSKSSMRALLLALVLLVGVRLSEALSLPSHACTDQHARRQPRATAMERRVLLAWGVGGLFPAISAASASRQPVRSIVDEASLSFQRGEYGISEQQWR